MEGRKGPRQRDWIVNGAKNNRRTSKNQERAQFFFNPDISSERVVTDPLPNLDQQVH